MYPPPFEYRAPETLDEALSLLAEHGSDAKVLAGGQSLLPLLKLRFSAPELLVDLQRVDGLARIDDLDDRLEIGAMVRQREVEGSAVVQQLYPLMASAAPQVSDPLVRNLATVCGSIAHADPAGDWGSVMLALGAEVVARSSTGERTLPIGEFFRGALTTALEPSEILTALRIPKPAGSVGGAYLKLKRKVGDFATVGVATQLEMDDGRIGRAGVALTAVGEQNLQVAAAEESLRGAEPSDAAFEEAAGLAAEAAEPSSDVRGSAEYKREMVRELTRRGLRRSLESTRRG